MSNQEYKYFYEDEVYRITKNGTLQFGMVVENAEFASSGDESDSDEDSPVKAGQVRVSWYPHGREEVVSDRRVHLADRSLMPGDIVRRLLKGKKTQMGYCRDVKVLSSIQILGTQQVIFGVKSETLVPLETFKADILICLDGWVGMVREVKARITLRFNDGSKVIVGDDLAEELEDVKDKRDSDCEFKRYDFYPGQVLFGAVKNVENGEWSDCSQEVLVARKHKPYKAFKMTVEEINFVSLGVSWMCRAYFSSNSSNEEPRPQPSFRIDGDKLSEVKMLNVFEPATLQIGDRNFYTITENDIVLLKSDWKKLLKDQLKKSSSKKTDVPKLAEPEEVDDEDNSSDFEDVDDGSDAASVSSHCSSQQNIEDKQDKKKKKNHHAGLTTKVLKKKKLKKSKKSSGVTNIVSFNVGDKVVTETLSTRSEVEVVWQDGSVEVGVSSSGLYPVQHLDDHEFFPGDFVTEAKEGFQPHSYGVVQDVDHAERCCKVKWFRTYTEGAHPQPIYVSTADASVYDLKDHPDFKFRPGSIVIRVMNSAGEDCGLGAGQVLDNSPSGQVSVWWAGASGDGVRSSCWPQDLYRVGEYDSDDGELWDSEFDGEESEGGNESWETEEEEERVGDAKIEDLHNDEDEIKNKLAEKIEKARIAMTRLEEIFSQNPSLQTPNITKQLLEVYRDCRGLDRLMGTEFFHEREFAGLLDKVRDHDRISSVEAAVKDQVSRLFSTEESPGKDSGNGSFVEANLEDVNKVGDNRTDHNDSVIISDQSSELMCGQLCTLIKDQLLKAHGEVVKRFGDITEDKAKEIKVNFDDIDLSELDMLVARGLEALNFFPITQTPAKEATSANESDAAVPPTPDVDVTTPLMDKSFILSTPLSPGSFVMMDTVPQTHKFKLTLFNPANMKNFLKHVRKELKLLETSLPAGIVVKGYEDRMDLFSAMIHGPKNTPYEDGLFFFDFQLGPDYPSVPPLCHYVSFCSDRLNPNLYEEGKVCVSLLGTWSGKGTETWTSDSNLLQLLVSIQGLILVPEPYFNEAGYERQKGTQTGEENSRMYNEMAVLKLVQSMTRMIKNPAQPFSPEILDHMKMNAHKFITRLRLWRKVSMDQSSSSTTPATPTTPAPLVAGAGKQELPDFPLIPASKGFCLTLDKALIQFEECLTEAGVTLDANTFDMDLD